ncbi:MAG: TRAP transporter substrate-binding protein [Sutterellaceae bacterium]|nr:TRAP transporter substrate-binding protein [Sutterellaceae bacterium]MDD7441504.1 TRAP transporter substrate-binding protein [Sutterellaceae bacterium]MDY2869092.1 TRAP transporter substrate-binding protein [Mesosutterella sp.]
MQRRDLITGSAAVAALAAIGPVAPAIAKKKVWKLQFGHTGAPNHHYQKIAELFAKRVSELTDGGVKIQVFPSDQLGKQLEITEGVMLGTHQLCQTSDTILSNWIPDFGITNLPFIFNDDWDYRKVFDGPVGEKFAKLVEPKGAVVIGWWENGMRHVTNNKREIKSPKDMKGLNIRVPEGEIFVDTFKALGCNPTIIAFGELYSALQMKTVDGQENPPAHVVTQKFYEVQKYITRTGHIHMSSPILMNKKLLLSMPKEYQEAILKAGREMGPIHTKMVEDLEAGQWKEIAKKGMKITDVDKAPFRAAVKPVIDKYKKKLNGKLIEEVMAAVAAKPKKK